MTNVPVVEKQDVKQRMRQNIEKFVPQDDHHDCGSGA
jgi:hypothetical protein